MYLYPGGGDLTAFGLGGTGTGRPGLGGMTLAPVLGSSTGGTGCGGSRMRDGGLLYGSPLLVLPVGAVSPLGTAGAAGAAGAGAAAGLDLSGTGAVFALFGAVGFGDTILLVALPLVGGGSAGAALGAA